MNRSACTLLILAGAVGSNGLFATSAKAQFGVRDGAYRVEPWAGSYSGVEIQVDQKIVTAGTMQTSIPNYPSSLMVIARYLSTGMADPTFGSGGPSILPGYGVSAPVMGVGTAVGTGLRLQSDGTAVVTGFIQGSLHTSNIGVARFKVDGTLESGFGTGGWNDLGAVQGAIGWAIGLQSSGKIVVGGFSTPSPSTDRWATVARFNTNGSLDSGIGGFGQVLQGKGTVATATGFTVTSFGKFPLATYQALAIQPADDKIVTVGILGDDTTPTNNRLVVARYTAAGNLDTTFNAKSGYSELLPRGLSSAGSGVALQSDGKIVVVGSASGIDGAADMLAARYTASGTLDTSFGGGSGYVRIDIDGIATQTAESASNVLIQPDGKILIVGSESLTGSSASNVLLVRLKTDGTRDAFGINGIKIGASLTGQSFSGNSVALQSNGIIVAGAESQNVNSVALHPLLMWFSNP